jgi:hypothetical protein
MDKYLNLLLESSNKSSYRKSPIKTAEEVDKLVKKAKKDNVELKARKIADYDLSTPMRVKISEARIKAGKKSFKEQIKLFENNKRYQDLQNKLTSLRQSDASQEEINKANKDIEEFFSVQNKKFDLEKEAEKYKDEPLKYLAKLQELKSLETKPQQQNAQLEKIKQLLEAQLTPAQLPQLEEIKQLLEAKTQQQLPQLEEIKQLLEAQLTPTQLLQTDKEFKKLTPKERDEALKRLSQATPRDTTGRKEIVLNYLKKTPEEKKEYINKIKASVPEKTIKATEIKEKRPVGRPKKLIEEVVLSQRVTDLINRTTFDDDEQKKFVRDTIMRDVDDGQYNDSDTNEELQASINMLKSSYYIIIPKATDINFEQAANVDEQKALVDDATQEAELQASKQAAAEEVVAKFEHPADEPIVAELSNVLEANDDLKPEEAEQDARDAVSAANAELNIKASEDEPQEETQIEVQAEEQPMGKKKKKKAGRPKKNPQPEPQPEKKPVGRPKKSKGKGFRPLADFPLHLVAGSLSKHVERVRRNRHNARVNKMAVLNNVDNQEYRQNMTKHILNGNRLGQWLNV